MTYLAKVRKCDLSKLAYELGEVVPPESRIVDLKRLILNSQSYEEEFAKQLLETLIEEREQTERAERERMEQTAQTEQAERIERERKEQMVMEFELEKLRIQTTRGNNDTSRSTSNDAHYEIRKLMPKYESKDNDLSFYLILFERQAKRLGLDEDQWAFSLLGLLPYEMTQLIARETEEQSGDYRFVKRLLLKRYKLSPEQFRQKFEKHERSQKGSWRDFAFELRGYFNEWIEGMNVENFDALKDLSVTNQLKKKVPNVLRNHLIDDWTKLNNPDELADKLDEYENVRTEMGPPHWNSKHTTPPSFQQEIKTASKEELKKISKNDFLKCFEDWKNRWHKCIISHGDYFKGDKIDKIGEYLSPYSHQGEKEEKKTCNGLKGLIKKTTRRNSNNIHDRQKYIEARREYFKLLQRKRDEFNKDKNEMIKNAKDPKSFWNAIAAFRKKTIIQGEIDIKEWFLFYKNLLNKENNEATFTLNQMIGWKDPDLDAEITLEEIYDVVKKLANGKAVGLDGIPNELLKNLPIPTLTKLKNLFNKIMSTEKYPQLWTNSIVHPIYKSGDKNNPTNFRGIALCSNISKLFTTILRNRLNNWIEKREIILENQAGFRKNRSCTDHILLLNSLIQLSLRRKRGKLYVFFVDLTKAFDTVPHDLLWQKLHKMGISNKFVMLIKNFYKEAKITIRWKGQYSSNVKINSGVLQGESLSPLLFILYMADLIELYNNSALTGFHLPDFGVLHLLLYADDIAIIGESKINLQIKINLLKSYLNNNKLVLNENKSKIMVFRNGGRPARHEN
ncbi:hypothetical protein LAZ67_8002258 [Cordylochernes scorpioides]|uniref:Reverse transcriptase domain-containing protein n=1 Tax=Cordylochernes scorpioides TaxID=51811 RepID=A0ABY6KTK9_9ARAC|nr:hypothetical protein LAZ67_8002258 [Cordylochernes scorpioides]